MTHPAETPAAEGVDAVRIIAEHCVSVTPAQLPEAVKIATRHQILDTLGIGLAGSGQPGVRQLRDFTADMAGKPESTLWGSAVRVPAQDAARVNAAASHALEYDDTHEASLVHPAVITVPAALAVAEMLGDVSGEELMTAVALGVDVACRLAAAASPGVPAFVQGWHNTTVYGFFASAIVAGRLMRLTPDQLISALGIAYHQAAGNSQAHLDGALTKRLGPGFASYGGVLSARLAARGVQGATGVLEGVRGFFSQYHGGNYSREILLGGLGTSFASEELSFKPWPACRGTHTAIDAALRLRTTHGLTADDVTEVAIANGPGEYGFLASPLAQKQHPSSPVDAQFSVPWAVAAALTDGEVGLAHFTVDATRRSDLLGMAGRIVTSEDDQLANPNGGPGAARVRVRTTDGRTLEETVVLAKGEPADPLSEAELFRKFADCARLSGMPEQQARLLLDAVGRLDSLPRTDALTSAMIVGAEDAQESTP